MKFFKNWSGYSYEFSMCNWILSNRQKNYFYCWIHGENRCELDMNGIIKIQFLNQEKFPIRINKYFILENIKIDVIKNFNCSNISNFKNFSIVYIENFLKFEKTYEIRNVKDYFFFDENNREIKQFILNLN